MKVDYIKKEISTEISEEGGANAQIVNNQVLALGTAVEEAINGHYVMGDKTLITNEVMGVMKSIVTNCSKDGNARQIGDCFTVHPQYYGLIDPDVGHDPAVNGVFLRMRLLKEMKVDTSGWTFNDVTPGKLPIKVYNASTGGEAGLVNYGGNYAINFTGTGLLTANRIDWYVEGTTKTGSFAESALDKDATVIRTDGALAGLNDNTYEGKTIVFTVRGEKNCATAKATLHYVEPTYSVTKAQQGTRTVDTIGFSTALPLVVTGYFGRNGKEAGDQVLIESIAGGATQAFCDVTDKVTSSDSYTLTLQNGFENTSELPDSDWNGHDARIVFKHNGTRYEHIVTFSAP